MSGRNQGAPGGGGISRPRRHHPGPGRPSRITRVALLRRRCRKPGFESSYCYLNDAAAHNLDESSRRIRATPIKSDVAGLRWYRR